MHARYATFLAAAFAAAIPAVSTATEDPDAKRLEMEAVAKTAFEARKAATGSDVGDAFDAVGVHAERSMNGAPWRVEVEAFTTGIGPGAIVEFFLITLNSGHDYEALFQTAATGADIRRAFNFVGLEPGTPPSPADFRFWPRGERAEVRVIPEDGSPEKLLESFVVDSKSGAALSGGRGFVYTAAGGKDVDTSGPGSIVSAYNEAFTLFDVPRLAAQSDVYESIVSAPFVSTNAYVPAKIVFSPEKREDTWPAKRVRDLSLRLHNGGFSLDGSDAVLSPVDAARELSRADSEGTDAFASFSWDSDVRLGDIKFAARLLSAIEESDSGGGLRMNAPPEGFPYYKAFLPRDEWRDRSKRFTQPCELRFRDPSATDDAPNGAETAPATLVRIDEEWEGESLDPKISTVSFPVADPANLPALLKANSPDKLRVLLVFAPSTLTWGDVAPWLDAVRETHPVVQLFLDSTRPHLAEPDFIQPSPKGN